MSDLATWAQLRWVSVRHPRQVRRELAELCRRTPWYAEARPVAVFQHWAPDLFLPVTMCGKWAGERSSGEIRTLIGWHCRKCHRRAKRALKMHRELGSCSETVCGVPCEERGEHKTHCANGVMREATDAD